MALAGGASIVVQGPAVWQLESGQRLLLNSGKLLAHVPKAAVGFTVVTPTAEIIDLGTDFSVVVDDRNQSRLAVTQGAVQVMVRPEPEFKLVPSRPAPLRVAAGEVVNEVLASGTTVVQSGVWDAAWTRQIADLKLPLSEPAQGSGSWPTGPSRTGRRETSSTLWGAWGWTSKYRERFTSAAWGFLIISATASIRSRR